MEAKVQKISDVLVISRGPGMGTSLSIDFDDNLTFKELPDLGAEIQIAPERNSENIKFYFGYDTSSRQFKRELTLSKSQLREVIKHLIDLV
jgi:hypothetical protein